MRKYEIVVILDATLDEEQIQASLERLSTVISSNAGDVVKIDHWGRRRFAYELADRWEGYYVVVEADGLPETVAEVDRILSIADEVLRHKVVRLPAAAIARRATAAVAPSEN